MPPSWDPGRLGQKLDAIHRLRERRRRRVRRRAQRLAPWLFAVWVLVNIPPLALLGMVIVSQRPPLGELARDALAVLLWALITGGALIGGFLIVLLTIEIIGRSRLAQRKEESGR